MRERIEQWKEEKKDCRREKKKIRENIEKYWICKWKRNKRDCQKKRIIYNNRLICGKQTKNCIRDTNKL